MNIPHYTHHRQPGTVVDTESLAKRILSGPALTSHRLVDDNGRISLRDVERGKGAAFSQRDLHDSKIVSTDCSHSCVGRFTGSGNGTAFKSVRRPAITGSEWGASGQCGSRDTRQVIDSHDELLIKGTLLFRFCVTSSG